ncbi:hypothetical protein GTY75_08740 [Streptomyces sp. SID8381]|uniref:hypothetical protein n=1 Tax=unclassified Streptomyces TaxID=2593676 RepID=UPI000373B58B|nr:MULTISPECIES: hypothetical protein [unclassified Streptomyces]MYX26755.1 hypothetical protein [Streptomyces sp. SID8381]
MPPRTRKTTTAEQNEDTAAAAESTSEPTAAEDAASDVGGNKAAPVADVETKIPDVAPLEPPSAPPEPAPELDKLSTAQQLLPADLDGRIVDDATGEIPDPDGVFITVGTYGERARCTVRLVEHTGIGVYKTPITRLLVAAGAELKKSQADRITARLRQQLATAAAAE